MIAATLEGCEWARVGERNEIILLHDIGKVCPEGFGTYIGDCICGFQPCSIELNRRQLCSPQEVAEQQPELIERIRDGVVEVFTKLVHVDLHFNRQLLENEHVCASHLFAYLAIAPEDLGRKPHELLRSVIATTENVAGLLKQGYLLPASSKKPEKLRGLCKTKCCVCV